MAISSSDSFLAYINGDWLLGKSRRFLSFAMHAFRQAVLNFERATQGDN